jgi:hypothetical protein
MSDISTLQRDEQELAERLAMKKEKLGKIVETIKERD